MKRTTDFVDHFQITVQFACYPPYHSKYNPIERVWGVLEKHWNGSLLDSLQTILNFARSMTYKGKQPLVEFATKVYHSGVKLAAKQMNSLEQRFSRLKGLEKWFVRIEPLAHPSPG